MTPHSEVPRNHLSPTAPWQSCSPPQSALQMPSHYHGGAIPLPPSALSCIRSLCSSLLILVGELPMTNRLLTDPRENHYCFPEGTSFLRRPPNSSLYNLLQNFPKNSPRLSEPRTWIWTEIQGILWYF